MSITATHPNDTPCPEWCTGEHGRFPHKASFGSVVLTDDEFACHGSTAVVTLTNDCEGRPAVEFGDGQHTLTYRFNLDEAEQIHDALGRAIDAARAAEAHSTGPELARNEITTVAEGDPTLVCVDCGDEVFVWSTPDINRCWRCDERADAEAGAR
jgi:hypothetical protein